MAAMSSGRPRRGLRMVESIVSLYAAGSCASMAALKVGPGATALARIPSLPHFEATCQTREVIPAFVMAYAGRSGSPTNAAAELV